MTTTGADPREEYRRRLDLRRDELSTQRRVDSQLSIARLLIFLAGAACLWPVLFAGTMSWMWLVPPAVAFVAVAWLHDRVIRRRTAARRAVAFYEAGLARLDDRWSGTGVQGTEFLAADHAYADDLDLFGRGSLFELFCSARTRSGKRTLASWLLAPAPPEEIRRRQEAVRELRGACDLREEIARLGEDARAADDPDALTAWAVAAPELAAGWPPAVGALLATGNLVSTAAWLGGVASGWVVVGFAAASAAFVLAFRSRVNRVLGRAGRPEAGLELLAGVLERLERERFRSPYLQELRAKLGDAGTPPSRGIARLARLVELHDSRRNMIFAPIAALVLLGTLLAFRMERWRATFGPAVGTWLDVIGRFEALCSIAAIAYERPHDVFPEIVDGGPSLVAEGLGHPLLPEDACVRNDVSLGNPQQLLLISGSNMSGKSTLLRTVGISAVLAQAGAPVRALRFDMSPLAVGASMNIRDSLQEGTSHFYAEIKRLRRIVDLGRLSPPLLFLLDEILHGTNSHDRRIGAEALIRELLELGAVGLVTTHDLALAEIAASLSTRADNVHFEDQVDRGRISFDYRLKQGVVRHSNALELMRSVGLNV